MTKDRILALGFTAFCALGALSYVWGQPTPPPQSTPNVDAIYADATSKIAVLRLIIQQQAEELDKLQKAQVELMAAKAKCGKPDETKPVEVPGK